MESTPRPPQSTSSENPRVLRSVNPDHRYAAASAAAAPGLSISVGDIYYTVFRHKWKVLILTMIGLGAAFAFHKLNPAPFLSEARLFIRYVMETREAGTSGEDTRMKAADQPVINSELQIMTSLDLLEEVAQAVGPERILADAGGGDSAIEAAGVIRSGLTAEVPARSSIVRLLYSHPDRAVVQPILAEVIRVYLKRHVEVHRSTGMVGSYLAQETDQARARLQRTDDALRLARNRAGVISMEDSKQSFANQIDRIRQEIFAAEAQVAERKALLASLMKSTSGEVLDTLPEPTADQIRQYQGLLRRQAGLHKLEEDMIGVYTDDNPRVRQVRDQLENVSTAMRVLEEANPKVVLRAGPATGQAGSRTGGVDFDGQNAQIVALEARIKLLNAQLESVRADAAVVDQMEVEIMQLTRQKQQQEDSFRNLSASLERMRISDALGSGSVTNILIVQNPAPPSRDNSKTMKVVAGLSVAGLALGLGWAFLIELLFDRSVRRPAQVERMLNLPLLISIPKLTAKQLAIGVHPASLALPGPKPGSTPPMGKPALNGGSAAPLAPAIVPEHPLHPFHETLRDRLIGYFESVNLTHKPKLVAVTGLANHSGVTTTAAGLAASLSETGDGNVLLVDMTVGQGSAQQFYQGKVVCGLEQVLDARNTAQIENNLYVVGEEPGGERLSRILPNRFNKLVPKLKASNFDYIIFDMPPVSQISITPRLAGYMDMVLLVLESEKTDQHLVQRATSLLSGTKAHVGAVLNKTKTYVPAALHQDNLGNS